MGCFVVGYDGVVGAMMVLWGGGPRDLFHSFVVFVRVRKALAFRSA